MTPRSLRRWFVVHKWTSLVCTLFLLMLCVTGLPLIFWSAMAPPTQRAGSPSAFP